MSASRSKSMNKFKVIVLLLICSEVFSVDLMSVLCENKMSLIYDVCVSHIFIQVVFSVFRQDIFFGGIDSVKKFED